MMPRFTTAILLFALVRATDAEVNEVPPPRLAGGKLDYNRDVQPILSNACYHCHGPDTASRKAGLRLDLREQALSFKNEAGERAIVPGKPDESELVRRIESHDPDELMPKDPDKRLTPAQIALLREWIRQGAEFRDHWAFEKPVKAPLPEVGDKAWVRNPVDAFVLAKLEAERLHPSPQADGPTLLRRVTLDLTGLLPTLEEQESFATEVAKEGLDTAYEKAVDRLLASSHYGEHRARYWLDYARYGDTHGIQNDKSRHIYPWRDYVIRSFNADKPYDQFTREQLAGDLLPPRRADEIVATGYIRNGISTGEGGTIIEELRFANARERTEAFGALFMGMSVGCAVCHDHKYDPITQRDFYALSAFFNNLAEKPSNDDRHEWPPYLNVPREENQAAYDATLGKKADLLDKLDARRKEAAALIPGWIAAGGPKEVSDDGLVLRLRLDDHQLEGDAQATALRNSAPGASPAPFITTGAKPHWGEDTWLWPSFRLETNTVVDLGQSGDFEKDRPFSGGGWIKPRNRPNERGGHGLLLAKVDGTAGFRGWQFQSVDGADTMEFDLISAWPADVIRVSVAKPELPVRDAFIPRDGAEPTQSAPAGEWSHFFFTYDGSGKAAGVRLYLDGVLQPAKVVTDALRGSIKTEAPLLLGRQHKGGVMQETGFQDVRLYARELSPEEVARVPREDEAARIAKTRPAEQWTADERKIVADAFLAQDAKTRELWAQLPAFDAVLQRLAAGGSPTLVAREKVGTVPYADVLSRGGFSARIERVGADTPHFLPPMAAGEPRNRLGLANWVLSADNPLAARTGVNRAWQEIFGAGLVETSEDFGVVGDRPSHQALLDWLAVDFREGGGSGQGWQMKRLYKMLVVSATYRQSAKVAAGLAARDPKNRLLARGPRFRMEGEMLRDCALQAGGLLSSKIGGPSVRPYQPANIWESSGNPLAKSDTTNYVQDHGESLYRRSMYTFWKRLAIMPNLDAFDATDRSGACIRRQRTNTPLAALVTQNDPQYLEAARALGRRALKEGGADDDARIAFIMKVLWGREPGPAAMADLRAALAKFRDCYAEDAAAKALLRAGESPADPLLPPADQAVWMLVASILMNADETLNK